jgi:putative membrane protein
MFREMTIRNFFGNALPLLVAWMAALLAMPVVQWAAGHPGLIAWVILGVLLQTSLVILFVAQAAGVRRATLIVITVAAAAWAFEALGSKTGILFGAYHYTEALQPQLLGVPLLIPLAWLMMLPPSWAVAQLLTGGRSGLAFVTLSALAFTAWDLFLDPQMVHWGLWIWDAPGAPGAYFGIPLVNFAGWLLVSALITALARPPALPDRLLVAIYALTWVIETVVLVVFLRLYGPALCGFIGMGVFVVLVWRSRGRMADGCWQTANCQVSIPDASIR